MTPIITKTDVATAKRILFRRRREREADAVDFTIRPISTQWRLASKMPAYKTATANCAYIWRDSSPVDRFGPMPTSFAERRLELRSHGLILPASAPEWATKGYTIWQEADRATDATCDATEVSAWHILMQIPTAVPPSMWKWLVVSFVERELAKRGMAAAWAIHALEGDGGEWIVSPHAHLVVTARFWRHSKRHGERHPGWINGWPAQFRLGAAWRRWVAAGML